MMAPAQRTLRLAEVLHNHADLALAALTSMHDAHEFAFLARLPSTQSLFTTARLRKRSTMLIPRSRHMNGLIGVSIDLPPRPFAHLTAALRCETCSGRRRSSAQKLQPTFCSNATNLIPEHGAGRREVTRA
jgi:hypothetical protein